MIRLNGPVDFLQFAAYIIIFGFLWRYAAMRFADHPIGQAMAFVY
jgi:hypothetical protein